MNHSTIKLPKKFKKNTFIQNPKSKVVLIDRTKKINIQITQTNRWSSLFIR